AFAAPDLPAGATIALGAIYGTATIDWTPAATDIGNHAVTIHVADSGNGNLAQQLSDLQTITLRVRSANASPILAPIGDRSIAEGQALVFTLPASDADADPLTFSATGLPAGASLDAATGVVH